MNGAVPQSQGNVTRTGGAERVATLGVLPTVGFFVDKPTANSDHESGVATCFNLQPCVFPLRVEKTINNALVNCPGSETADAEKGAHRKERDTCGTHEITSNARKPTSESNARFSLRQPADGFSFATRHRPARPWARCAGGRPIHGFAGTGTSRSLRALACHDASNRGVPHRDLFCRDRHQLCPTRSEKSSPLPWGEG
jgi:hypothetical protein